MNTRRAAIERMAEQDPYWRGYLAGLDDRQAVVPDRTAELEEVNRLLQARLDRVQESPRRASFMSDKISMDEARAKVAGIAERERHMSERVAWVQAATDRLLESTTQARDRFAFRQEHDPADYDNA